MITPASVLELKEYVPRPVLCVLALLGIAATQMVLLVVIMVPPLRQFVVAKIKATLGNSSEADPEKTIRAMYGIKAAVCMWKTLYIRICDNVAVGNLAKDVKVVALDNTEHTLMQFAKKGRPLVLRFGSCS